MKGSFHGSQVAAWECSQPQLRAAAIVLINLCFLLGGLQGGYKYGLDSLESGPDASSTDLDSLVREITPIA